MLQCGKARSSPAATAMVASGVMVVPQNPAPMPPHGQIFDFLPHDHHHRLLDWALQNEARFEPATIIYDEGKSAGIDSAVRDALKLSDLGPVEPVIRSALLGALPRIMELAGYRGPEPRSIEFDIVAYGDGAHFRPHVDIPVGSDRKPLGGGPDEDRVITALYYFHGEPKGFSGGALRLYRFGASAEASDPDDSVTLEPVRNSLAVFPSWAMHGVEQVRCPSGRFADFRFGLNCWMCRKIAG